MTKMNSNVMSEQIASRKASEFSVEKRTAFMKVGINNCKPTKASSLGNMDCNRRKSELKATRRGIGIKGICEGLDCPDPEDSQDLEPITPGPGGIFACDPYMLPYSNVYYPAGPFGPRVELCPYVPLTDSPMSNGGGHRSGKGSRSERKNRGRERC
ncbi:uncharacterized protein LOC119651894 [Hermetia illucens]|uniref:uncharacterized protein LOC119651894 n=1 Tax=Hermetia illucens TaxID=343691 RepID=UPI0018CC2B8D|nr:uncharacterized protein LOC119651894 [Hermetia illucens]